MPASPYATLEPFDPETKLLNAIIDTPKGSRNKYEYSNAKCLFQLSGVLPVGAIFPYDFGYVPSTVGDDGDPIDILVFMDVPAFVGCLVPTRLIGVIEAEQTERDGTTMRNDRLIGIADDAPTYTEIQQIDDLGKRLLDEVEHFFISYNMIKNKTFKPLGRQGEVRARELIEEGRAKANA